MNPEAQIQEVIDQTTGKVYLPPCQIACPIGEDIQRTNTMISMLPPDLEEAKGRILEIGDEIYEKNPLFTICSYICGLCENECNYKDYTGAIRRSRLKRFLTNYYLPHLDQKPSFAPPSKEKVAVIGGGPGGLMCAYVLRKQGYKVTVIERGDQLGGALRYIPLYRLPRDVLDRTLNNLVRIANIDVQFENEGKTLADLKREGYQAVFIATGTPLPRPLTFGREKVTGADLEGVMFGLNILHQANQGLVSTDLFQGRKVIVIGGGNVAFDVARTARRLGGDVQVVCLECEDKSSKDGIPADTEEIEGATQEGLSITYSRGVREIIGQNGKFKAIKSPRCTSVFDEKGFNPQFDESDEIYIEGDVLLPTIGQAPERVFFQAEDLLDERGRLDVNQLTLMSNKKEGVFIGGDVRRIGFAVEAMQEGARAAESIERYIRGIDLIANREKEYQKADIPQYMQYKPQPELRWASAEERLNFQPFEETFTLEEAIEEARRCLHCGPCDSCKACIELELQPELPKVMISENCDGCAYCVDPCPFKAITLIEYMKGEAVKKTVEVDEIACKGCGVCQATCPKNGIFTKGFEVEQIQAMIDDALKMGAEAFDPLLITFCCNWCFYAGADLTGISRIQHLSNMHIIRVTCAGMVHPNLVMNALRKGADGVLICGCRVGDCHYIEGNVKVEKRAQAIKLVMQDFGIAEERFSLEWVSTSEAGRFAQVAAEMAEKIKELGPSPNP